MFALRSRRDKWRIIWLGTASFLVIFPLCVWRHLDVIEKDIYERSTEALAEARIAGIDLLVAGRDISLSAAAPGTDTDAAVKLLATVNGVRKVEVQNVNQSGAGAE